MIEKLREGQNHCSSEGDEKGWEKQQRPNHAGSFKVFGFHHKNIVK